MISKVNVGTSECFVIASGHRGLPGCYATERAARYAFRFSDKELQMLQDNLNRNVPDENKRMITFEMLQAQATLKRSNHVGAIINSDKTEERKEHMLVVALEFNLTKKYRALLANQLGEILTYYEELDDVDSFERVYAELKERVDGQRVALLSLVEVSSMLAINAACALTLLLGKRPVIIRFWGKWNEKAHEFEIPQDQSPFDML